VWVFIRVSLDDVMSLGNSASHAAALEERCRERIVTELLTCQPRLRIYISALSGDRCVVDDLLQETNLQIWRTWKEFDLESNFFAWAARIAFWKVKEFHKRQSRSRLRFDDAFLQEVSDRVLSRFRNSSVDEREAYLHACLERLPREHRKLLEQRYEEELTVNEIAKRLGKSAMTLAARLYRIRLSLIHCIELKTRAVAR
jgi:RNA polymerase sigma-70 factor (ECF subfamily)